jgi:hypothetical protein
MHTRRLAAFLLGAWLVGSLFMMFVATQNFRAVDRLLESPTTPLTKIEVQLGGKDELRQLLRHQVAEINRYFFECWEYFGIALAICLGIVLVFATNANVATMALVGLMLLVAVVQRVLLTPEIIFLGRHLDFLPPDAVTPDRARFWNFHIAYSASELLKLFLGIVLGAKLMVRGTHSRRAGKIGAERDAEFDDSQVTHRSGS